MAVAPPLSVHLQDPQIHPELNLLKAVFALESAHDNLAGLVVPVRQQVCDIEIHSLIMERDSFLVQ